MAETAEEIKKIILSLKVPKNSFELSLKDESWVYGNLDLHPRDFILGLLKRKFDNAKKRFNSDEKLAFACHEIIKRAKYEFDKHPFDKSLLIKFRQGRRDNPKKIILAYRQLWRGYSEDEVKKIELTISEDKRFFQNALTKALKRNSVLMKIAKKDGNYKRVKAYEKNESNLYSVEKGILNAFTQNQEVLARRKLIHRTEYRRRLPLGAYTSYDDYLHVLFNIQRNNPDLIEFPLRFMGHLPCTTYNALSRKWLKGCSRDEMMLTLNDIEGNNISDICKRLLAADEILAEQLYCKRSIAIKEIEDSYESGLYIASTLLATTQTEGVLWDFARFLNRRNIRIFKEDRLRGVVHAYLWSRDKNAYVNTNLKTKRPICSKKRIYGAGSLLYKTRLGSFIPPKLVSYLLDDFLQDRDPLAHGNLEDRGYKPNAIAAINCLMACFYNIAEYLVKIKE